ADLAYACRRRRLASTSTPAPSVPSDAGSGVGGCAPALVSVIESITGPVRTSLADEDVGWATSFNSAWNVNVTSLEGMSRCVDTVIHCMEENVREPRASTRAA